MADKPEVVPMQVTTLEAVAEALVDEKGYCELCGVAVDLWPAASIRLHAYENHRGAMWPQFATLYEKFAREPDSERKRVQIAQMNAEYLVKLLASRFDLYEKLVAAGVIVKPAKG